MNAAAQCVDRLMNEAAVYTLNKKCQSRRSEKRYGSGSVLLPDAQLLQPEQHQTRSKESPDQLP